MTAKIEDEHMRKGNKKQTCNIDSVDTSPLASVGDMSSIQLL